MGTSKHWQAEVRRFLGICLYDFFIFFSSFIPQILSFENFLKRDTMLASVTKQWIAKDILSYGSQSKCPKIAIHRFGKYL